MRGRPDRLHLPILVASGKFVSVEPRYVLSPDRGYAVRDVVRRICERMGRDFEASTVTVGERLGQDAAYVIDSTRAREEFGWSPEIALEEGLAEVVGWIEEN